MSKKDTERAKKGLGNRSPAIKCKHCEEWYSPDNKEIARPHVKGICNR